MFASSYCGGFNRILSMVCCANHPVKLCDRKVASQFLEEEDDEDEEEKQEKQEEQEEDTVAKENANFGEESCGDDEHMVEEDTHDDFVEKIRSSLVLEPHYPACVDDRCEIRCCPECRDIHICGDDPNDFL